MCAPPTDPKDEGNTVFQVKRVNATENLLGDCHVVPSVGAAAPPPPPCAPPHPGTVSHVAPALAGVLRYERTHSESSGTASVTQCQVSVRDLFCIF